MDDVTTIAALEQRVAELEELVARLATDAVAPVALPEVPPPLAPSDVPAAEPEAAAGPATIDRRRLLARGGTAAVGAVLGGTAVAIASAGPAAAASTVFEQIEVRGSSSPAIKVTNDSNPPFARPSMGALIEAASIGLMASGAAWGVHGASDGHDSVGVFGHGGSGYGLMATGARANILMKAPGSPFDPMPDPTTASTAHQKGELYWSDDDVLWVCIADGTPGTWRRATGAGTAGAFTVLPSPVRVYDSRPDYLPTTGPKTKLTPGVDRVIDCTTNTSGIPTDANALAATITITNPTGPGWLSARANGATFNGTSTLNWTTPDAIVATTTTSALGPAATIALRAHTPTDAIVDVIGYWR